MGGVAAGRLTGYTTLSQTLGAQFKTLVLNEIPPHDHGGATGAAGGHQDHSGTVGSTDTVNKGAGGALITVVTDVQDTVVQTVAPHAHSIPSAGGGNQFSLAQPTLITNKIIFAGV
jgi:microcystin-dependent protein